MNHRAVFCACIALAFAIIPSVFAQTPTLFSSLGAENLTAVDGGIVFNGTCAAGGGVTENRVGQRLVGGASRTIYTTSCGTFNIRSRIAADEDGWFYWITQAGSLRAHLSSSSNTTESRGTIVDNIGRLAPNAQTPTAVSATRFFWAEQVGLEFSQDPILRFVAKDGSSASPTTIFDGTISGDNRGALIWLHALSDTDVLGLTSNGSLMRFRLTTLTFPLPTSFWSNSTLFSNVQIANTGDGRLWFAQRNAGANRVEIRSIAFADIGTPTTEHARVSGSTARITGIDGDESHVFYHNRPSRASSQGILYRKARGVVASVAGSQIADTPQGADNLHVVGRRVIWRQNYNRTMQLSADAIALIRNLDFARMMEPVQIVQNPSLNVPMIRGKETVIRVYPQLDTTNVSGETRVNIWPNVILHGEDSDGNRLPGSPLNPLFGSREFEFIMRPLRQNRDEIALFRLPTEWTEESSVRLRAELNPSQLVAESNLSDNIQTRTVTFKHKAPVELMIHPLSTTDGKIGDFWVGEKYFPRFQPMLDRAEALLPTDSLIHWWPGAIVIEEYEFPLSFGPYEFSEGAGDYWKVLVKLQFRQIPFKPANLVSPLQVRSAALFIGDDPGRKLNGVAFWDTLINKTSNRLDSGTASGRGMLDINSGISGVTLAHEIGHTFFRLHVDCPVGTPDLLGSYPYDTCNIDDDINGNIGWDPISHRQILFDDAGDLMSYAHQDNRPRWPSDFTYRTIEGIMDSLFRPGVGGGGGDKATTAKAGDKGGAVGGSKEWMVFGGWNGDGTPEILFMQPMAGNDLVEAVNFFDNAEGDRTSFKVRGLNASGNVVVIVDAVAQEGSEEAGLIGFTALMPENNSIVRVELVRTAAPNTPLAFVESGPAVPTVSITAPTAGASPTGNLTVRWTGSDADNDPLFYTVQLSRDGVSNWQTLTEQTLATSINVDLSTFAGDSANCRVRVIASDGIHCATATSGRFTLPDAQPEIYTFYDAGRGRKCDHLGPIIAEAGATIVVTATALDAEDGMIRDGDIAWRLTGPVARNGTGTRYDLADLPPGTYSLRCTATTSSGQTAVDTRTLEVLPKEVPDAPLDIDLDGWPDEAAWAADRRPVSFTYTSGERATVRMIHRNGNLYVGVSGLPKGSNSRQFFGLTFHPDSGGGTSTTANDQRFSFYLDGEITRSTGNGSGYINQDELNGFQARIAGNDDFWAIEACIPDAALGGWNDQIVRIGVGHYHRNFSGDDTFWPANGFWNRPGTWGLVRFGEPNPPPVDDDGDGLLDAWERTNWGTLNRDGLGDSDGDGQSDRAEFEAGTNPRAAASALKFADATVTAGTGGGVTIQWASAAGPTYDLFGSPHPEGPYTLVQAGINATPPRNTFTIPPPTVDLRFFRISTTPVD